MEKNKVGIITFHNAHNYGAVLQAYGLYRKLELMNIDAEFIQDSDDSVGKKYKLYPSFKELSLSSYIKAWIRLLLDYGIKSTKHAAFEKFIAERLPSYNLASGKKVYSSVVLGSDQIWNFNITKGLKELYFGQDKNIISENVLSYAASMGNGMSKDNFTANFKEKLTKLNYIGVREQSLQAEIKNEFGLDANLNVDPTLLLEREEWDKLANCKIDSKPYILVYEVEKNKNTQAVVDHIKTKLGLTVKTVAAYINKFNGPEDIKTASPQEFISLFKNADFVVTTSFHGTVFSIINEVPFYTVKFNNKIDLRSAGLLNSVDLNYRHINSVDDIENLQVNFDPVRENLKKLRAKSESYLVNSLFKK